jgi:pSer/pThr/pTyr-binding forkhead associated (FHA) protein
MSYLIMRRGPDQGKIYPLDQEEIRIGRGQKNDIIIDDNDVSRGHLRLVRTEDGYELYNESPDTDTFVNGQIVDGVWLLQSRCIIELGETITLEYRLGAAPDKLTTEEMLAEELPASDSDQAYLVVSAISQGEPVVYPLDGAVIMVGRATTNDIVVIEPEMSREHFRLIDTPQGYIIEDLGSTNGTQVNGIDVDTPRLLNLEDAIQVGVMVEFRLTRSPDRYAGMMETDLINEADSSNDSGPKRKTSQAEIPGIVQDPATAITKPADPSHHYERMLNPSLKDQVLVTFARQDWEWVVEPLVEQFEQANIDVWTGQDQLQGSGDWKEAMEQARLECWLLLVVVSPAAMQNDQVRKNWRHFQNREKPIILMILEPVERMPIGAENFVRIDYNPGVPDIAFQQIVAEIKRLRPD